MHRPRPALTALAGLAAVISLAACGDTSRALKTEAGAVETSSTLPPTPSSATTTTRPPTTTTSTTTTVDREVQFRAYVSTLGLPPDIATTTGHTVCDALDRGLTVDTVLAVAVGAFGASQVAVAGKLVGASVSAFCPQHLPAVGEFIAANS